MSASIFDPAARPVIAHRGASARAPENTLRAFELALDDGADALELDVHVTVDGVPIVLHDDTVDRTTNGAGAVRALTLDQVRALDAGARFTPDGGRTYPWRGQAIAIPTLSELLARFPTVPCIVEVKDLDASRVVRDTIASHDSASRCLLMSFDAAALAPFHEPPWRTGATSEEALALIKAALLRRVPRQLPYRALSVPLRWHGVPVPVGLLAQASRSAGVPTHVWVVDSVARARALWRKGVCGIVTNRPRDIVRARAG